MGNRIFTVNSKEVLKIGAKEIISIRDTWRAILADTALTPCPGYWSVQRLWP